MYISVRVCVVKRGWERQGSKGNDNKDGWAALVPKSHR